MEYAIKTLLYEIGVRESCIGRTLNSLRYVNINEHKETILGHIKELSKQVEHLQKAVEVLDANR